MTLSDRLLPNLDEMSNPFLNYTRYAYKTKEIMEENAFIIKMKTNALKLSRTTSPRNQVNCKGNLLYACTTRHKEHIDRETTVTKEGRDKGKNINAIERYKFPF